MKTSELTGAALDWAVEAAQQKQFGEIRVVKICRQEATLPAWIERENAVGSYSYHRFSPSTDGAQGIEIIEREFICVNGDDGYPPDFLPNWDASVYDDGETTESGHTPLIAAMRCYVASELGDTVDIPEELA